MARQGLDFYVSVDASKAREGLKEAQADVKATADAYRRNAGEIVRLSSALDVQAAKAASARASLQALALSSSAAAAKAAELSRSAASAGAAQQQAAAQAQAAAAKSAAAYDLQAAKVKQAEVQQQQLSESLVRAREEQLALAAAQDKSNAELAKASKLYADASAGADKMSSSLSSAAEATGKSSSGINSLVAAAKGLTAAALAADGLREAVGKSAELSDELQAVEAFSGASAAEMGKLKTEALALSSAAGGPAKMAEGMADLASSGASVSEILGTTGVVRDMTSASNGALQFSGSADLLTNTLKQFGLQADSARPVADRLVAGWTSAGQSAGELGEALKQSGAIFAETYKEAGKTEALESAIAAISVLAEVNKKGSEGGNALKMALSRLIKPSAEAADVLSRFPTIKVFDDLKKPRDFADVIDDIQAASLSARDQLALFGEEAGPAMAALVSMGGESIRQMRREIDASDGTAAKAAETLQKGLGGSLRQAGAEIERAAILLVDPLVPALQLALDGVGYLRNATSGFIGTLQTAAAAVTASAGVVMQLPRALESVTDWLGITDSKTKVWAASSQTAFSAAAGLATKASANYKQAVGAVDELAAAQRRADTATGLVNARLADISRSTGVAVASTKEFDAAVAAGKILWDDAASTWVGARKQQAEAAAKAAAAVAAEAATAKEAAAAEEAERNRLNTSWKDYEATVGRINADLQKMRGELGLSEELSQLRIDTLSAGDAWKATADRAKELGAAAREAATEAATLQAAGQAEAAAAKYEEAIALAEAAKDKSAALNNEVREGERLVVSQAEAYKAAAKGVQQYGELAISIAEAQKAAAEKQSEELRAQAEAQGAKADEAAAAAETLTTKAEEYQTAAAQTGQAWSDTWSDFERTGLAAASAVGASIDEATQDRRVNVYVDEIKTAATGAVVPGLAGGGLAGWHDGRAGGKIPGGPSSRDTVPYLLARGERVVKASANAKFGNKIGALYNSGDQVGVLRALIGRFPGLAADAGAPSREQLVRVRTSDADTGTIYDKLMTPAAMAAERRIEERRARIAGRLRR